MVNNKVPNQIKENIILAQNGNIEARSEVLKFIYPLIKDKCKDSEIQQETILRIVKYLNSFDVEKGNFVHWSMVIMKNTRLKGFNDSRNHRQKENCFANYSEAECEAFIFNINKTTQKEFEFNTLDINKAIREIVENIAPRQKEIFKLRFFENLTHVEIGEYLNITAGTSKSQLMRAKETIIKQLRRKYNYNHEQNKY